jgi:hypothetical protein
MTDERENMNRGNDAPTTKVLPETDLRVDFGEKAPGSSKPMPSKTREGYEQRIRHSVESQTASAEKAAQIFVC